jgi:hypothetical protein
MQPALGQLVNAIRSALRGIATAFQLPTDVSRAYEAYCFSVTFSVVKQLGYRPRGAQLEGATFVFPKGRRHITDQSCSFIRFAQGTPSQPSLELHANTYAIGSSSHAHEMDVGVVDGDVAESCRQSGKPLPKKGVWAVVECKCYDDELGVGIGRAFLGLAIELGGSGQYFALMTCYPWRGAAFDIVRAHDRRYFIAGPNLLADTEVTEHSLLTDLLHLIGR